MRRKASPLARTADDRGADEWVSLLIDLQLHERGLEIDLRLTYTRRSAQILLPSGSRR